MSQEKPQKALVCNVNFAGFEFPGLKLPNGIYAIAVSQVVELFQRSNGGFKLAKDHASRDIKYLLGKDFRFAKTASEINKRRVNILTLEQFGELAFHVAFKGNEVAKAILKASTVNSIEQAYDIAFGNQKALEEYQQKIKARVVGKITRRTLTDSIKDYLDKHIDDVSDNYKKWIYSNCSNAINRIVFDRSSKKLCESWNVKEPREAMTFEELTIVEGLERLTIALIDKKKYEPLSAVKEAGTRLLIEKIKR